MDDVSQDAEDGGELFSVVIGLIHIVVFYFLTRWCLRCCRGTGNCGECGEEVQAFAQEEQLQPKKSTCTCYVLWLIGGPMGAHHYYLNRLIHGMMATWTLNFLFVGYLLDILLIPYYVRDFNKLTHDKVPYDRSSRSLLIRLPLTLLAIAGFVVGLICYGPTLLQLSGAVDIDRIAAQTQANPYDTLGISRGATMAEAKSAYRKESLRWHPDKNHGCGKKCEDKMYEITKAFELIKKRRAPTPANKSWEDMLRDIGKDWLAVLEVFSDNKQR